MLARIYRPAKTATQSGHGKTDRWLLTYEPERAPDVEPLMGYTASADMLQQVTLEFDSLEAAIAYSERHGIRFAVEKPRERRTRKIAYADNFSFGRRVPWTH
jgi:hypothetical protein